MSSRANVIVLNKDREREKEVKEIGAERTERAGEAPSNARDIEERVLLEERGVGEGPVEH